MRPLARRALLAGMLVFAAAELPGLLNFILSSPAQNAGRDLAIARALPGYGVRPGQPVASLGDAQEAYWAHWAGTPVVAEIWTMDSAPFWSGTPAVQQAALRSMADAGAKAAVWRRDSDQPCPPLWIGLPENSGCLAMLPAAPTPSGLNQVPN
jgi:hypothetical protein